MDAPDRLGKSVAGAGFHFKIVKMRLIVAEDGPVSGSDFIKGGEDAPLSSYDWLIGGGGRPGPRR
ncbi:hypothetical protein GCM10010909_01930 [Acidocella aquatica]|uniref:Uncharacterized protein n=1 Tax=Acidocella aquatica TaxID=1922313 RepID=A0ABQ5ZZ67_9PROT|nr:hypothetical protein GCM10010909_01930 [Acidocella aquatica]